MFNTFLKQKIVLIGVALLIVAVGVFILMKPGIVVQAWQAAFGGLSMGGSAVELPLPPSSTISDTLGQENTSPGESVGWPSLLIDPKGPPQVSVALKTAVEKAIVDTGAVSSSSSFELESTSAVAPQWCDFSATDRATPGVILNEVAWMGSTQSPNDEWLELKSISGQKLDLHGWQILNQSGSIKISFGATSTLTQEGFLVLKRDGVNYSGALVNSGDWLKVFNRDCKIADELDAGSGWPAGNNTTKKTLERDANGSGWHTSVNVGGTPGVQNSVVPIYTSPTATVVSNNPTTTTTAVTTTTTATSTPTQNIPPATSTPTSTPPIPPPVATTTPALIHLVIAVVQITGGEGVTDKDYIKIFNPTSEGVDISGWKLRKRTQSGTESSVKVFPDGSAIAPGGYFAWANSTNDFATMIGANVSSTQTLASDNSIALLDASSSLVDALAWGSGHIAPYIEGNAYPENLSANQQLTRKFEGEMILDAGNNAEDFELRQYLNL